MYFNPREATTNFDTYILLELSLLFSYPKTAKIED